MTALAFVMYGLGGATFDPAGGEATFVKRIAALNINIHASPYQWTDTQVIADATGVEVERLWAEIVASEAQTLEIADRRPAAHGGLWGGFGLCWAPISNAGGKL